MKLRLWWNLKDHGILMPYRTYRVAKRNGLHLSLVCALLVLNDTWRQKRNLEAMETLAAYIGESGLQLGVAKFVGGLPNAVPVFEAMSYFKTLGIN